MTRKRERRESGLSEMGDLRDVDLSPLAVPANEWTPLRPELFEALTGAANLFGCSDSGWKKYNLVHIHPKWVESVDPYQIIRYHVPTGFPKSVLVGRRSLLALGARGDTNYADCATEFALTPEWVHFRRQGDYVLSCRLAGGVDYLDNDRFLDDESGTVVLFPRELVGAVRRAGGFATDENTCPILVKVSLGKGYITVESRGQGKRHKEKLDWGFGPNDDRTFLVEPDLFAKVLRELTCECEEGHTYFRIADGFLRADRFRYLTDDDDDDGETGERHEYTYLLRVWRKSSDKRVESSKATS